MKDTGIYWWLFFFGLITFLLIIDLFVVYRKNRTVTLKYALLETAGWIIVSLAFNLLIYYQMGTVKAIEFTTAYLIEKSLSIDNLFVFMIIFSYYRVPDKLQHGVLFWGIIGSIVMRAVFIFLGIELIERFEYILYLMGLIIIYAGIQFLRNKEFKADPKNNFAVKLTRRIFPVMKNYSGTRYLILRQGKLFITPLFIVLVVIESTDIVFALDSVPAVLGISRDPFIVYTSNIFAILGLRALYFALAGVMSMFHLLKYGLGLILIFIGLKILLEHYVQIDIMVSLAVILTIFAGSLLLSFLIKPAPNTVNYLKSNENT
ncbi:TerC/Alx family metal homeostasis membrane protein [Fulvivirga sedimenti]|uniref:TerC/Alx family metal homeostasis membrane protein n=1 Tax=Fulvivirga sedimenti TaxID=2879465 RepID=A0A9X1KXH9_9BACT|nr:TerC/Alx family metal homeostasis membrane protein [Fulvivirga sedimenti]MCA6074758.1 TerC/Alx family metal homeostasis membrane protein [Fulvivirga sedimenti]MCA6075935.1 TerC/Alx family metal homeostasis membrane protein [Fulvivirga sedimenti]MCA6077063.1 TerC/Alx family metal homeostasis membrane protein [Fulvivirga sedimenti]